MQTEQIQSDPATGSRAAETIRPREAELAISQEVMADSDHADGSLDTPIYVDLDGSLIATDTLWESLLLFVRRFPLKIPMLLLTLAQGRAAFKAFVAHHVTTDPTTLPYRPDLLAYLQSERARGRSLVLATAAHRLIAEPVAAHLDLFDNVIATDGSANLSGENKLRAIRSHSCEGPFDYVGDAAADIPIFAQAREALLVSPTGQVEAAARATGRVTQVFSPVGRSSVRHVLRALRPHQWAKNVLVAVPLVTSHLLFDVSSLLATIVAFVSFCLVASGQYVINDLFDLEADRRHPRKRYRPFAAGDLSIAAGLLLSSLLVVSGIALAAWMLPTAGVFWIGLYFLVSLGYSLELKQHAVLDVLMLAALFTIRVFAGGAAIDVVVSQWLLTFSLFLFTSLAFLKRYVEARGLAADDTSDMAGRGYRRDDAVCILIAGAANGYLSVLVYALYVSSSDVQALYADPRPLWLGCPVLLYWVTRIWFLAHRDEMHHDPVYFTLTDRASYVVGLILFAAIAFAV